MVFRQFVLMASQNWVQIQQMIEVLRIRIAHIATVSVLLRSSLCIIRLRLIIVVVG